MANKKLDLHGIKHANVEVAVEDFVLMNDTPLDIITGNSESMKSIVIRVLDHHGFGYLDGDMWNRGKIVVV